MFKMPPTWQPLPLSLLIWQPFDKSEYQLSFARIDPSIDTHDINGTVATLPLPTLLATIPAGLNVLYYLHWHDGNSSSLNGSVMVALDSLCPQFDGSPNTNLFRCRFGMEFNCDDHTCEGDLAIHVCIVLWLH